MNILKKWVFPIVVFVVVIALLALFIVLGSQIGYFWAFAIEFILIAGRANAIKKAGGISYLREKTFLRSIIPVDEGFAVATVKIVGVAVFFVFASCFMIYTSLSDSDEVSKTTSQSKAKTDSATNLEIVVEAEEIVKKTLKSPSTAKFPVYSEVAVKRFMNKAPNRAPNEAYEVSSYVDSQNSFGVVIRSSWIVVFEYVGTMLRLHKVVIDGQVVYDYSQE